LEIHFLLSEGFKNDGLDLHWSLEAFVPSGVPHFGVLPSGLVPLGLVFTVLYTLGLYHLRLDYPGLRRIWTAPEGFCHPWD
jgi:hypothetical protein